MIPKTSTFPKGPHYRLEQGDKVQVLNPKTFFFQDCYVANLAHGDEYYAPTLAEGPRTAEQLIDWMERDEIEIQYGMDIEGDYFIELYGKNKREPMVKYPKGKGCLREAIEFGLDMLERKDHNGRREP